MSDLEHLKIWDDPAIRDALSWYLDVAENRRPAKFRIAATLATQIDPVASSENALWAELDRLTPTFLYLFRYLALAGSQKLSGWNCAITFTGAAGTCSAIHSSTGYVQHWT